MNAPIDEHAAMVAAAQLLDVDATGAELISGSSRMIWHLPAAALALTISRPGTKTLDDVTAETNAMRAATAAGVRTPALRAGPVAVPADRWAFATNWIDGRRPTSADWPAVAAAAARLAGAPIDGLRPLAWPDGLDDPRIVDMLGQGLHAELIARSTAAELTYRELFGNCSPVLAHTDLQPANALCNDSGTWLIDMEFAAQAPREWDPAKLVILANRFGDPVDPTPLLKFWNPIDKDQLRLCAEVQEVLIVAWLGRMATTGPAEVRRETVRRAATLSDRTSSWMHLH